MCLLKVILNEDFMKDMFVKSSTVTCQDCVVVALRPFVLSKAHFGEYLWKKTYFLYLSSLQSSCVSSCSPSLSGSCSLAPCFVASSCSCSSVGGRPVRFSERASPGQDGLRQSERGRGNRSPLMVRDRRSPSCVEKTEEEEEGKGIFDPLSSRELDGLLA